jgi:hypothetical protein
MLSGLMTRQTPWLKLPLFEHAFQRLSTGRIEHAYENATAMKMRWYDAVPGLVYFVVKECDVELER